MENKICRACGCSDLELLFDLGPQPLAGGFLTPEESNIEQEKTYPLPINVCRICGLVQTTYVIPADKLAAIVRESIDEVLCLTAEEGTCKITGSDSRFTIYGHDAGQYPAVPCFEGDADMEVSLLNLQSGIERCLFATAKESTRYALNGVLWEIKGKKLILVATDGRRLVRTKMSIIKADKSLEKAKMIVPAKTMALMFDNAKTASSKTVVTDFSPPTAEELIDNEEE